MKGYKMYASAKRGNIFKYKQKVEANYNTVSNDTTVGVSSFEDTLPKSSIVKRKIFNDIYLHDNIAGSAVDLISIMPWSDYTLTGVEDEKVLQVYQDCLEELNITTRLPEISIHYLVDGAFVSSLIFDGNKGYFTDLIPQNIDYIMFKPSPLLKEDPIMDLKIPPEFKEWLTSKDEREQALKQKLPPNLLELLSKGNTIPLQPDNTLFVSRRTKMTLSGFNYMKASFGEIPPSLATSYYERILPLYFIETALTKGTIISANKKLRSILHLLIGDDEWEPTDEEIEAYVSLFLEADKQPLGAIVGTRRGIEVNEIRPATDFWRISEEYDFLSTAKMRALGINDAFLSGDASYNTLEASLTVFVENIRNFRYNLTKKIFYNKIFPAIARANGFVKRSKAELDHNVRINTENIPVSQLQIPEIHWHKQLRPEADRDYLDILSTLEEKGLPIPLRVYASAGGLDLNKLVDGLEEEIEIRKKLSEIKKKLPKDENEEEGGFFVKSDYGQLDGKRKDKIVSFLKENGVRIQERLYNQKVPLNNKEYEIDNPEFRKISG